MKWNNESGQLRTMKTQRINLSLLYVCKQINHEAKTVPFRANFIYFEGTTIHTGDDTRIPEHAARFD